jgi:hypothetical protein
MALRKPPAASPASSAPTSTAVGGAKAAAKAAAKAPAAGGPNTVGSYDHTTAAALIRPEVGVQARFAKRKPPRRYAYDPSLAPSLQWDGGNPARQAGEALIARIERAAQALAAASDATSKLHVLQAGSRGMDLVCLHRWSRRAA